MDENNNNVNEKCKHKNRHNTCTQIIWAPSAKSQLKTNKPKI